MWKKSALADRKHERSDLGCPLGCLVRCGKKSVQEMCEEAEQDDAEQLGVLVQTGEKAESLMGCRKEQQQEEFWEKGKG